MSGNFLMFNPYSTASAIFGREGKLADLPSLPNMADPVVQTSKDRNILTNTICSNFEGSG